MAYGGIGQQADFFDPENKPLFGDEDEPDDEDYEGYTGNAGVLVCVVVCVGTLIAVG